MAPVFEPSGLTIPDVENLKPHYAQSLKHWLRRFEANQDTIRKMFDEPFVRGVCIWQVLLLPSPLASYSCTKCSSHGPADNRCR